MPVFPIHLGDFLFLWTIDHAELNSDFHFYNLERRQFYLDLTFPITFNATVSFDKMFVALKTRPNDPSPTNFATAYFSIALNFVN